MGGTEVRNGREAADPACPLRVRSWGPSRLDMLTLSSSGRDPGCVKTHTSTKCGKYNSPTLYGAVGAQHDLTLGMRPSSEMFYARRRRASFHTAKTRSGHQSSANPSSQNLAV